MKEISMPNVVLYGTLICPYCFAAKNLMSQKKIKFEEIRIDGNPELRQEMIAKSGRFTVPQIFINDYHVGGYDDLLEHSKSGKLLTLLNP
jgi:glutaredoxin 3